MSGPFTNTPQQLVEQINWLQTDKGLTWDNLRFGFSQQFPGVGNGQLIIPWPTPFPREVVGFSATLDFSGGIRPWLLGAQNVTKLGFTAIACLATGFGGFVDHSQLVGVYFLAWGR